jgi:glycerol-3-phosphate dehydrogenase
MKRDIEKLAGQSFDLLIIGGGIHGACTAWEAASRGLSVALLEKKDFAWATSANSLKIIHGGFRYLQHADLRRMRQSSLERRTLMRIAPHLVHPLPVLMPTYGHGIKGREVFSLGLLANHFITIDRNRGTDPQKKIPFGQVLSKEEVLRRLPGLDRAGLTGGIVFYDAQVYNSERLVLAFLQSAAEKGAVLANYAEATGFLRQERRVVGVQAVDGLSGQTFEVRARTVVNTAGPWIEQLLEKAAVGKTDVQGGLAKAVNLVTRPLFDDHAVGLMGKNNLRDKDALVDKGSSFLFAAPWRGKTLLGTAYSPYSGDPDDLRPTKADVSGLLEEFNRAYPAAELKEQDVAFVHVGLLPAAEVDHSAGTVNLSRHHHLRDHAGDGAEGLLSVVGVKYTTGRQVAQEVIERLGKIWGQKLPESISSSTPLYGGNIENFAAFVSKLEQEQPCGLSEGSLKRLARSYGSQVSQVLDELDPDWQRSSSEAQAVLRAETRHAVRSEMAYRLSDVLLRRSEAGTAGHPGEELVRTAADEMGKLLGWSEAHTQAEIEDVNGIYHIAD